jgi:hypothetical protein
MLVMIESKIKDTLKIQITTIENKNTFFAHKVASIDLKPLNVM